jgi:hypothetical protein
MNATPRLDDLVAAIENNGSDPLQHLTAAVLVGEHLDEIADHLIGHFVDRARFAGASWTAIGQSLGVTKQAAQKRFVPNEPSTAETDLRIFGRYTAGARQAIVNAQEEARRGGSTEIRPGHILLPLLSDETVLGLLNGIDVEAVRTAVTDALGTGTAASDGPVPFSAASKKAIELGHRESLRREDEHIGPEYVLLGVLSVAEEPEVAAAAGLGLDKELVEAKVHATG